MHGHRRAATGRSRRRHAYRRLRAAHRLPDRHVKYLEPSDVKPLTDVTEKRRYRHRGPVTAIAGQAGGGMRQRRGNGQEIEAVLRPPAAARRAA